MRPPLHCDLRLRDQLRRQELSIFRSGLSPRTPSLILVLRRQDSGRAIKTPRDRDRLSRRDPRCHSLPNAICRELGLFRGLLRVTSVGYPFLVLAPLSHKFLCTALHYLPPTGRFVDSLFPAGDDPERFDTILDARGPLFLAPSR